MKLIIENGALSASSVAKLIAIGWFFGWGALFAVFLIPMLVFVFISLASSGGLTSVRWTELAILFLFPVVLGLQAIMVGAIGALGYAIFTRYRSLKLEVKP